MVEVMKIVVTFLKRPMHVLLQSMPPVLQQATTDPSLCQRLPDTHRQASCGVTVPFSWVLVHKVLLCPPRVYFPVLCNFWQLGLMATWCSRCSRCPINYGKFWKRWEYQTTWPASWEICMQVRKQQLELDKEQQTGSKSGKEYIKAVYCHPAYLTYMQSTSWETLGWKKHKLESRLPGEISITSDMQMTPPYGRKWRGTKKPLDESERGEWKSWPKAQHSEN